MGLTSHIQPLVCAEFVLHITTDQVGVVTDVGRAGLETYKTIRLAEGDFLTAPAGGFRPATDAEIKKRHPRGGVDSAACPARIASGSVTRLFPSARWLTLIVKWIFSSGDASKLSRFKSMMERADIPCVARKTQLDLPMPLAPLDSELWVVNDEDYPKASGLVKGWSHPS